jgi:hypothetical protein
MRDFSNSKIYIVKNTINDYVYVGSTTLSLNERFYLHKCGRSCSLFQYVNNNFNGNWSSFNIELVENFPCKNKYELSLKEQDVLSQYVNHINKNNPKIYPNRKEYYLQNRELKIQYQLKYIYNCKLKNIIYIIILIYINQLFNLY